MMQTTIAQGGRMRVPLEPYRKPTATRGPISKSRPHYQYAAPIGPQPDEWRYIVIGGALFRYKAGDLLKTRERVPGDQYRMSELYETGRDNTPSTPEGYEWVTCARIPGTATRRDFYLKVGA